jgi:hypothetical protein
MSHRKLKRVAVGLLCASAFVSGIGAPAAAQAAFDDPLFLVRPAPPKGKEPPAPPPVSRLEGPCGLAVDGAGNIYLSDYYHHAIDVFGPNIGPVYPFGYQSQIATNVDPIDGPCGLALDSANNLYVNDFHRAVIKNPTTFSAGSVLTGFPVDEEHPTGVAVDLATDNVYVDSRTFVGIYDATGVEIGAFGIGSLEDAYGLAVSGHSATKGFVYVPDAGDNTIKVFDPATLSGPTAPPLAVITGAGTPAGHFTSLRDSAIAVDDVTGEIYVADNLEPGAAERPETVVYVFDAAGAYEGRLKNSVIFGQPNGLAVDNSGGLNQSRVYVTSGNTEDAAIYVYPPGAATASAVPLSTASSPPGSAEAPAGAGVVIDTPSTAVTFVDGKPQSPSTSASAPAAPRTQSRKAHKHKQKQAKRRAGHRHAKRHHR